jgi:flagellum-specific peptidoglycan hydrolase FlgJ
VDGFRAYDSWAQSVDDHGQFLAGLPRYSKIIGETDYKAASRAIKAAGYATAPDYADALIKTIQTYGLNFYDPGGKLRRNSWETVGNTGSWQSSTG